MQVEEWLIGIGMGQYVEAFRKENVSLDLVPTLTSEDLAKLGVHTLGDRKRLLSAGAELKPVTGPAPTVREQPSPERRVVTILFVDLTDYTGLSNRLDPEDLGYLQRRFWAVMGDIVASHGGTLKNRPGDALAAVFGFPVAHGNDSLRAASAALEMHAAIEDLAGELRGALGIEEDLRVHIGIASGEVYAGPPDPDFDQYEVVGAHLNLAARLSDLARPRETLITDSVYHTLTHLAQCGPPESRVVKGFPDPIAVRTLEGLDLAAPRFAGHPFVGRQGELARAEAMIDRCLTHGTGHVLFIRGLPGIGKTRLLHEIAQAARRKGFAEHRISILDFGVRRYLAPIRTLAFRVLEIPPVAGRTAREEVVERLFARSAIDPSLRVFVNDLLDVPQTGDLARRFDAMDLATRKAGRRDVVSALVRHTVAARPTLIAFEDIHQADPDTLDALSELGNATREQRLLLVMTTRAESADRSVETWSPPAPAGLLTRMDLEPLDAGETRALAGSLLASRLEAIDAAIRRSQGNPFFLEQLVLHEADSARSAIPASIKEVVQGRLARLSVHEREALQAASVLGHRFRMDALAQLTGDAEFDHGLLEDRMFIRRVGEETEFQHDLLRQAIYDSLTRGRRSLLHRKAAEAVGAREPELRARHLDLAGAPEAPSAYRKAAEHLFFEYRYEAALALADTGLGLSRDPKTTMELLQIKGEILGVLGRCGESRDLFMQASELADDDAVRCLCFVNAADCSYKLEDHARALTLLAGAEPLAVASGSTELLSDIHFQRGEIHYTISNFDECLHEHERAREYAELSGSSEALSQAYRGMGFAQYQRGRILTSQIYFERCVDYARRANRERIATQSLHMTGYGHYASLDLEGALAVGREARAAGERIGCRRTMMNAERLRGYILLELGRLEESEAALRASLSITRAIGASRFDPIVSAFLGRVHAAAGDAREAVRLAEHACEESMESNSSYMGPAVLGTLALVSPDVQRQDWALAEGMRLLSGQSPSHNHLWFHRDAMAIGVRRHAPDLVERHARRLEAYTRDEPLPWVEFNVGKARCLARIADAPRTRELDDVLASLHRQAVGAGLEMERREIERAMAS